MQRKISSQVHGALFIKKKTNENPVYPKKCFAVLKYASRRMIVGVKISNLVAKDSRKGTHEETGDEPMPKDRKILDEAVNLKSTTR